MDSKVVKAWRETGGCPTQIIAKRWLQLALRFCKNQSMRSGSATTFVVVTHPLFFNLKASSHA